MPFSSLVILLLVESAKLRALRTLVPYVPCGLGALVPYVRLCLTCLVPYVLSSPPSLVSYMLLCPVYLASDMLLCLTCSCVSRDLHHMWPSVSHFMGPFSLRNQLFRTLSTLCLNNTFCASEFPCVTLLFFC